MGLSNLPPGVTDRMIEEAQSGKECPVCDEPLHIDANECECGWREWEPDPDEAHDDALTDSDR